MSPFDIICEDILKKGDHSVIKKVEEPKAKEKQTNVETDDDLFNMLFRGIEGLFTFKKKTSKS